jgi:hypothetical protein
MITYDLIDECSKILGDMYVNASTLDATKIRFKIEEADEILNKLRVCPTKCVNSLVKVNCYSFE